MAAPLSDWELAASIAERERNSTLDSELAAQLEREERDAAAEREREREASKLAAAERARRAATVVAASSPAVRATAPTPVKAKPWPEPPIDLTADFRNSQSWRSVDERVRRAQLGSQAPYPRFDGAPGHEISWRHACSAPCSAR
jgi:hypothetical protein